MRKSLLTILFILLSLSSYAQKDSLHYVYGYKDNNDTIKIALEARIYAFLENCQYLDTINTHTTISNDTIRLNAYYDLYHSGSTITTYCSVKDTASLGKVPSHINIVHVKMFSIEPNVDTVYNKPDWFIYLPLNIPKYSNTEEIQLYPNPATNNLNILFPDKDVIKHISVTDISGRTVFIDNAPIANNSLYQLNTTNLPEGMYLLHLVTSDGKTTTKRFIKTE